jgi:hypothetical protein
MNRTSIKLIKRHERESQPEATVEPANPNRGSTAVRSWVADFQQRDRNEFIPAFDSLFKDALPDSGGTD